MARQRYQVHPSTCANGWYKIIQGSGIGEPYAKIYKLGFISHITYKNQKWTIDQNLRAKTYKTYRRKNKKKIVVWIFLNKTQKVKAVKKKINKLDFTKNNTFGSSKPSITKNEKASQRLRENTRQDCPTKDLDLEYEKYTYKSIIKKHTT